MHSELIKSHNEFSKLHNADKIQFNDNCYKIIKFKTPIFSPKDNLISYIEEYIIPECEENDIITIAESVLAVTQNNAYRLDEIQVSKWSLILFPWVSNVTYGTGLGMAETMQCAINTIGLKKILKATLFGAMDKLMKRHGSFYKIAGPAVKSIDFKKEHPIPFRNSHNYIVLSPKNPNTFCRTVYSKHNIRTAVMDVNNVSVDILGYFPHSRDMRELLLHVMKGNPAGQENERNSIIVVRKYEK